MLKFKRMLTFDTTDSPPPSPPIIMEEKLSKENPTNEILVEFPKQLCPCLEGGGGGGGGKIEMEESLLNKKDVHKNPCASSSSVLLFGFDISHLSPKFQLTTFTLGVFSFTLVYGCLQELLAVKILNRQLGLFLTTVQFFGYALWSFVLARIVVPPSSTSLHHPTKRPTKSAPFGIYLRLAILRALDVGLTNLSMQYLNYPAKTLIKSSRVAFTMITGTLVRKKRYSLLQYTVVLMMISGLVIFLNADFQSEAAVFHPIGVVMLLLSLTCDGMFNNWSEVVMEEYQIGQDEFLFQMFSFAFVGMAAVTHARGELTQGLRFIFLEYGTFDEAQHTIATPTFTGCSPFLKVSIIAFFTTTGLLGSSAACGVTKYFGALTMSITSTARKALTLFLSFLIFQNKCNADHVFGIAVFLCALVLKTFLAAKTNKKEKKHIEILTVPQSTVNKSNMATTSMKMNLRAKNVSTIRIVNNNSESVPPGSSSTQNNVKVDNNIC